MGRRIVGRGAVAGICLFAALGAWGAIPGASDPKAYTYHDFTKVDRDYNRRTIVEPYKSGGKRDPKWDKEAVAALEALAERFTRANLERLYFPGPRVEAVDVLRAARKAADLGCEDPMVLYAMGAMLDDLGRDDEAKPVLVRAVAGFEGGGAYGPARRASAALRLTKFYRASRGAADVAELGRLHGIAERMLIEASKKEVIGEVQRHVLYTLTDGVEGLPPEPRGRVLERVGAEGYSEPWVALMVRGVYHKRTGWDARGKGFAQTVTEEGWKVFGEELAKARDALIKAHALRPQWPEAATAMIEVAMGGGAALGEEPREWFEKATRAQLDWRPAYESYVWSIYPRWGGSHAKMFEFGVECARTGRFDTSVPFQLIRVCERIDDDSGGDFAIFGHPPVFEAINTLFEGWERKAPEGADRSWYRSRHLVIAWRAKRFTDAARVLARLEKPDLGAFERARVWAPGAISEVHAMASPHGATLAEAEKSAAARDYEAAFGAYKEVLGVLAGDDSGVLFVKNRAKQLEHARDLWAGKAVMLSPGAELLPWFVVDGEWSRGRDGSLTVTTRQDGHNRLLCRGEFGDDYDLMVVIDWPDGAKTAPAALYVRAGEEVVSVALSKTDGKCWIQSPRGRKSWDGQLPQVVIVQANLRGGKLTVKLNGGELLKDYDVRLPARAGPVQIGVGSPSFEGGLSARFREIRVMLPKDKVGRQ